MLVVKTTSLGGLALVLGLTVSLNMASAQGSRSKTDKKIVKAQVEGELIKRLGEKQGAGSDSKSASPSSLGLKVSKVIGEDGSELPDMKGKILSLRKNKKRDELLSKYIAGDKLTLMGKLDTEKATLELESFKGAGSDPKLKGSGSKSGSK